jgi:clan AA aspartic protease
VLAQRGVMPTSQVRSILVDHVLVDTGATGLCLPADIIQQLGLELIREAQVEIATGFSTARIFGDASITVEGRTGTFECLELPGGRQPLLGVVPLEWLGINLDLANERMTLLPDWGDRTYLTIL